MHKMPATVLVVDDNKDMRRLLSLVLERQYNVEVAADAIEAIHILKTSRPTHVFLDLMMPGNINGFDVLKYIKNSENHLSTKVAMITAKSLDSDKKLCEQLGADAYFLKPFSPSRIRMWIENKCNPET